MVAAQPKLADIFETRVRRNEALVQMTMIIYDGKILHFLI